MLKRVFEPLRVGSIELPNRVVRTAHGGLEMSQRMSDDYIAYHARRAKGGCGLTILGAASVHPSSQLFPFSLFHDDIVDDYARLMTACRPWPMKVFAQLWHGGNLYPAADGGPGWAVSDIPGMMGMTGLRMSDEMIRELIAAYSKCAVDAREGGLHGVEVHAAHGYLPQQFLSSAYNDRNDQWGGSFENRSRFLLEILRAIRAAVGNDLAISVRLAASEMPGGISVEENQQVLSILQAENLIDMVNVSLGDYYKMDSMVGAMQNPTGYEIHSSGKIAAIATVPRLLAGRYRTLDDAEQLLRDGTADLVSMVRAQIADPDLVNKTRNGLALTVRPCIGCNQQGRGGRFGCAVNPAAGIESTYDEDDINAATVTRKVIVVGGGPGGMEAARVAALRGHDVVLFEAAPELGGMLNVARRAPYSASFGDISLWLEQEIFRLGVDVRLNTYVDAADVLAEGADHVIIATGSQPRMDGQQHSIPTHQVGGVEQPHVISSIDLLREDRDLGQSALVLDTVGDYEGLAATEFLLERGLKVTYVTGNASLAEKSERRLPAWERFLQYGNFELLVWHHLVDIEARRASVRPFPGADEQLRFIPADTVVLITPNQPQRDIFDALQTQQPGLTIIGDAKQPRDLLQAIWEGHRVARSIN